MRDVAHRLRRQQRQRFRLDLENRLALELRYRDVVAGQLAIRSLAADVIEDRLKKELGHSQLT